MSLTAALPLTGDTVSSATREDAGAPHGQPPSLWTVQGVAAALLDKGFLLSRLPRLLCGSVVPGAPRGSWTESRVATWASERSALFTEAKFSGGVGERTKWRNVSYSAFCCCCCIKLLLEDSFGGFLPPCPSVRSMVPIILFLVSTRPREVPHLDPSSPLCSGQSSEDQVHSASYFLR